MSRRGVQVLALAAAGGVGYYLYNAGGDPKTAQKQFEADAAKASEKIQGDAAAKQKEAEKKGEALMSKAGTEIDKAAAEGKSALSEAQAKAEEYRKKTGTELNKAVDKFDKTVEEGTAKAKSGISSWFGGGGSGSK